MKPFVVSLLVEIIKFRRSKTPLITGLAALMIPFAGGFFMFVLKNPGYARKMGFIAAKAQLAGTADWPSYFALLSQAVAIGRIRVKC